MSESVSESIKSPLNGQCSVFSFQFSDCLLSLALLVWAFIYLFVCMLFIRFNAKWQLQLAVPLDVSGTSCGSASGNGSGNNAMPRPVCKNVRNGSHDSALSSLQQLTGHQMPLLIAYRPPTIDHQLPTTHCRFSLLRT